MGVFAIGDRVTDTDILNAGDGSDIAAFRFWNLDPLQSLPAINLSHLDDFLLAVYPAKRILTRSQRAVFDPAYRQASDIVAII